MCQNLDDNPVCSFSVDVARQIRIWGNLNKVLETLEVYNYTSKVSRTLFKFSRNAKILIFLVNSLKKSFSFLGLTWWFFCAAPFCVHIYYFYRKVASKTIVMLREWSAAVCHSYFLQNMWKVHIIYRSNIQNLNF